MVTKPLPHLAKLSPQAIEVLWQLFRSGPTWDGNIVSKSGRDELIYADKAQRLAGWTFLTIGGIRRALAQGYDGLKEREPKRRR